MKSGAVLNRKRFCWVSWQTEPEASILDVFSVVFTAPFSCSHQRVLAERDCIMMSYSEKNSRGLRKVQLSLSLKVLSVDTCNSELTPESQRQSVCNLVQRSCQWIGLACQLLIICMMMNSSKPYHKKVSESWAVIFSFLLLGTWRIVQGL